MFRILDVQRAWHARSVAPDSRLDLTFEVQDAQLDGNSGRWRVIFADGRAHCERGSGAATMSLDIGTLSRLYIGALPASAAVAAGLAVCDRPGLLAALDAALALPEPWTFDRF
jgi:predicted acetyltransferase